MPTAYVGLRLHDPRELSALPPDLEQRLAAVLPFEPDHTHHIQRGESHLWVWFKDAHLQPAPSWSDGDAGAAAVAGYGIDADGAPLDAASVARQEDMEAVWRRFHGEWSACCIARDGTLAAISCAVGTEHVYFTEQRGFTAISNRARLLWAALRAGSYRLALDLETLAGLLSVGYPTCTDRTAVRGVRLVSSTDRIEVRPEGGTRIHSLDPTFFLPRGQAPDWRQMADGLRANVRWLLRSKAPILATITGGKDSRLVLAALRSEGIDQRARFYLTVPPEHADFLVARAVAERLGLALNRSDPVLAHDLITCIQRHVALTEGALNAWDLKDGTRPYVSQIEVEGLFGELYRGRVGPIPGDLDAATRGLLPRLDRAGMVRTEVRRAEEVRLRPWIADLVERGVPWDRLRDVYYLRHRISRWMGQARLLNGLYGLQVNPLYLPLLLQGYGVLSRIDRVGERIHFELMRILSDELISLPFACDRWDPAMLQRSSAPETISLEPTDHVRPILGSGWQTPALRADWQSLRDAVEGALGWLDGIVIPARVNATLDVLGLALGVPMSTIRKVRIRIRHRHLIEAARANPQLIMMEVFGLLTIAVLPDEVAADPPARVQVSE